MYHKMIKKTEDNLQSILKKVNELSGKNSIIILEVIIIIMIYKTRIIENETLFFSDIQAYGSKPVL